MMKKRSNLITGAGPSRPLRGAIVGYGFIMEKGHVAAYAQRADDVQIVAVADVCEARREHARRSMPGVRVYEDHKQLLDAESARLDFVDIAAPPADHAQIALDALDAGLHVLCEKPLAASTAQAAQMLERAKSRRRVLYPCHNYKHAPVVKSVRRVIESGAIGNVHMLTMQTFRNTHALGVQEWRPHWRRERRYSGGGIAMDHGSHTFYLAFEWMRSYPTMISAHTSTRGAFNTEDDFACSAQFPTGFVSAHLSWTAGVRKVLYTIHGDLGAIRVEDDQLQVARLREDASKSYGADWHFEDFAAPSDWMDSSHVSWFNSMFDEFKIAIERGDWVSKETEESYLCVQLIQTAYASAAEGSRQKQLPPLSLNRAPPHVFRPLAPESAADEAASLL